MACGAIGLKPRPDSVCVGQGATVLATSLDGALRESGHGLWVNETRMLSRYEWRMNDASPHAAGAALLHHDRWLGYFLQHPSNWRETPTREEDPAQQSLELRITRRVAAGLGESIEVTNHTQIATHLRLSLELEADFADRKEAGGERRQHGDVTQLWTERGPDRFSLSFRYRAEHAYEHQGRSGVARVDRSIHLELECAGASPRYADGRITFAIDLAPHASWRASLTWTPRLESSLALAENACARLEPGRDGGPTRVAEEGLGVATELATSDAADSLSSVVAAAVRQATRDMAALRLLDEDGVTPMPVLVGGWPTYTAFFGRDALAASWQSGMVSTEFMRCALAALASSQATDTDPWRDAQPGRMLHEHHNGPLAALQYGPHGRYYGDVTSSVCYPVVVSALWHWTGDLELVRPFVAPALRALAWADRCAVSDAHGFYQYQSFSEQGEKNQGWKDSDDAIVHADGSQVVAPLGTCEMQAFVYASKLALSELLVWTGDVARARRLYAEARDLKRRFNRTFWMEDERYVPLAIDGRKQLVRSIASDAGHCLVGGIVDDDRVPAVVARLMSPELFSGWGVRTLSSRHPAYNPFAYHRGTVWPVENAVFAFAFARFGLYREMHALCRAQFEAARLFESYRLPETFAGHPRDDEHPFPGLYPRANWPQAWSASAVVSMLQTMLGIVPYAPLQALMLDPHLPEWLPHVTLSNLRVGGAAVDIRFDRRADGRTEYEVLDRRGKLRIVRQPRLRSLMASWPERLRDAVTSVTERYRG